MIADYRPLAVQISQEASLKHRALWLAQNAMRLSELSYEIGFTQSQGDEVSDVQRLARQAIIAVAHGLIKDIERGML